MTIGTDTITIYQGEDVNLDFTMDPVVDITGWTLLFSLKDRGTLALSKAGSVTNGPAGTFRVTLADTDTEPLTLRAYEYDVWRTDAGGERLLAVGPLTLARAARDL